MTTRPSDVTDDASTVATPTPERRRSARNVARWERAASAVAGGVLLRQALRRRSLRGVLTAFVGGNLLARGVTGHSRLYEAVGVNTAARTGHRGSGAPAGAVEVERSVTVRASPDELDRFWRDPAELTRVVGHVADVTPAGGDRLRWVVDGPLGWSASWETRIVEDRSGERLRWESVPGAAVPNEGTVRFRPAPDDRGTEVTLRVRFDPPGGRLGAAVMNRLGALPEALVGTALYRFRSLVEAGEVPTLERNPSARGRGDWL